MIERENYEEIPPPPSDEDDPWQPPPTRNRVPWGAPASSEQRQRIERRKEMPSARPTPTAKLGQRESARGPVVSLWERIGFRVDSLHGPREHMLAASIGSVYSGTDAPAETVLHALDVALTALRSGESVSIPVPRGTDMRRTQWLSVMASKLADLDVVEPDDRADRRCRVCLDRHVVIGTPVLDGNGHLVETFRPCHDCRGEQYRMWQEGRFLPDGHPDKPFDKIEDKPSDKRSRR